MVRATGLEPARGNHWNLNPTCLPIPPRPHIGFFFAILAPKQKYVKKYSEIYKFAVEIIAKIRYTICVEFCHGGGVRLWAK